MHKTKNITSNEIIKSYTLADTKKILTETFNNFLLGKTTEISDWEYDSLYNLINQHETFEPVFLENNLIINKQSKTFIIKPNIKWEVKSSGILKPFFIFHNNKYSLKSYNYVSNHNMEVVKIIGRDFCIDSGNTNIKIICPICNSTKISIIHNNPYCASKNCTFWFKHFYDIFVRYIDDDAIRYFIKHNVEYDEYNVLSKVFTENFINTHLDIIKDIYGGLSEGDTYIERINNIRMTENKDYIDMISNHLKEYIRRLS